MAECNDKGRQARRYFIECERQLIAKLQELLQTNTVGIRLYLTPAERLLLRAYQECCDSENPRQELIDSVHWILFEAIKHILADESDEAVRTLAALSARFYQAHQAIN